MGNHRSGRKPKPTHLKVLEGNPGRRKLPADVVSRPEWPKPPEWLTEREVELWNTLKLHCSAWVLPSDWPTIWATVSLMDLLLRNREAQAENEGKAGAPLAFSVKVDGDGTPALEPKENPLFTQHMKLWNALRPFLANLGLSPVDRAKVHGNQPPAEVEDKWAGILG